VLRASADPAVRMGLLYARLVDMTSHSDRAIVFFEQGYNCAQATCAAFAADLGLDVDLVTRMVAGLGGGRGGQRETCGAVSAMAVVAGLGAGSLDPNDLGAKRALYARIQEMEREFLHSHGSTCCRELLLTAGVAASPEPSERTPEYCAVRPCARFVATAAAIASRVLPG
jgi:C_GCAxxG_C_C family probable redox protein